MEMYTRQKTGKRVETTQKREIGFAGILKNPRAGSLTFKSSRLTRHQGQCEEAKRTVTENGPRGEHYVQAYLWVTLAAAKGIEEVAEFRDALEKIMTHAQLAEAQRLEAQGVRVR